MRTLPTSLLSAWRRAALAPALLAAAGGGLVAPPPPAPAPAAARYLGRVSLAADLPALLRDHLDPDGDGLVPRMDTTVLWGRPRLRLGASPWLAARFCSWHRLGVGFVNDIALTWWGLPVLPVIDAFVDGRGMTRVAGRATVGDEVDQGANLFLWSEAALIPSTFAAGTPVVAVADGPATVRLTVPLRDGTDTAWLHFADGHPSRFTALRHKGVGGAKVWWHVDYEGWGQRFGIPLPARLAVTWADEDRPWFRMALDGLVANAAVDERLDEVGRLIRDARGG